MEITKKTIDIEGVVRSKSEKTAKMIPGFIYAYLKKIIHQDMINAFLYKNKDIKGLAFVDEIIRLFDVTVNIHGLERIPEHGRYLLASNHPLGGLDGIALMQAVGKKRRDLVFPVNDLLMFLPQLKELFIPINKHGSNTENLQIINNTFDSEKIMLFFPAGLVSRKQNGKIEDLEWKPTIISRAKKHQRPIIPVYIDGQNSKFFYRLANLRKFLRIKTNIEMLYLVNEMAKQKGNTINIRIGEPIPWQHFDKQHNNKEWAQMIKRFVYDNLASHKATSFSNKST